MTHVDFVIVGQGLAGTALAWQLLRRGRSVLVIDRESGGSSRIAAGLITPITGKRLAKSWRWDELFPAAVAFYRSLEAETGEAFFHQRPAVRLFADESERDEFGRRMYAMLAGLARRDPEINREWFDAPLGGFEMPHAARLDVPRYLDVSLARFRSLGAYLVADIDPAKDIELIADGVRLPRLDIEARGLVFCRGFAPGSDLWFGGVKFNAAKGEILTVRIPSLTEDRVVHRGLWLSPVGRTREAASGFAGGIFLCGSTYTWDDLNCEPTAAGRAEIERRLREFLRLPFEVLDHRAAVRPVIDAGFPVLERHAEFPQLAYFNGLGSKGSLLAPFFAEQLAELLVSPPPAG